MPTLPSVCPLDCPDRCSLDVSVEGDRVTALRGSRVFARTEGYICGKVARFGERVHGERRVREPAIRVGPKGPGATFRPLTWDEALSRVADRFREIIAEDGPEAVLPAWYGGSNGMLTGGGMDIRFWNRLGASRCGRTLCAANTGAGTRAVYGNMASADLGDVDHARLVVLWGANPSASGIHLAGRIKAARPRLVVVDPRRTPLLRDGDLHLPILPGTDVPVALALVHVAATRGLADLAFLAAHAEGWDGLLAAAMEWSPARASAIAGVPADAIVRFAELYAEAAPALLRCGWGLERNRNGSDAVKAVLSLPAVFGKFGVRGGGYAMSTSAGYRIDAEAYQGAPARSRTVNLSRLAHALATLDDPPIRALYVYNCNPVATLPDQAALVAQLVREDLFTVVHEQVWTDSCDYADIVLPATTFLEHEELTRSYSGYVLQWAEPVIPPVGRARSNHAVFSELATRMGFGEEPGFRDTPAELAAAVLAATPNAGDFATLRRERAIALPCPVQFVDAFPPDRIRLSPPPRHRPPPADAELPLMLVSPASPRAISSTGFESLPAGTGEVEMHPDDAAARGIVDGAPVRVWNSLGEVRLLARIQPILRPGVASIPKGLWRSATLNGWTANALVPAHVDEAGGGACYNDARVEISRWISP